MTADRAIWRDLGAQFKALTEIAGGMRALYDGEKITLVGGPNEDSARERLRALFLPLARRGAIAAGLADRSPDGWLNLLREKSPFSTVMSIQGIRNKTLSVDLNSGVIKDVITASTELCVELETCAFELTAMPSGRPITIRQTPVDKAHDESSTPKNDEVEDSSVAWQPTRSATAASAEIMPLFEEPDTETDRRACIDAFIERIWDTRQRRITRTDIWHVAGYTDATQFQRYQRAKKTSDGSIAIFNRVLRLEPEDFLKKLDRLTSKPPIPNK